MIRAAESPLPGFATSADSVTLGKLPNSQQKVLPKQGITVTPRLKVLKRQYMEGSQYDVWWK